MFYKVSRLETQVASLNERLSTALSEQQKFLMKADTADKRAGESQSVLHEEKVSCGGVCECVCDLLFLFAGKAKCFD